MARRVESLGFEVEGEPVYGIPLQVTKIDLAAERQVLFFKGEPEQIIGVNRAQTLDSMP